MKNVEILKDTGYYLHEEVSQQIREKVNLKLTLGESDAGTSHSCFCFVDNITDSDMLSTQIWQYIYTKLHSFLRVTLTNGPHI